mmetsp:Transcript_7567/g.9826  ORF Transcript_7567/g.9826 Transcript_7567/m.9826 type:complete len:81 (+) Transcript_7567:6-248(+)
MYCSLLHCIHATILMKTGDRETKFEYYGYSREVTGQGKFVVDEGGEPLFSNECDCATPGGLCDKTFEIKLQFVQKGRCPT